MHKKLRTNHPRTRVRQLGDSGGLMARQRGWGWLLSATFVDLDRLDRSVDRSG